MLSTSSKIAFGYLLLIGLLFGAIGYIYEQMTLLVTPTEVEEVIGNRRRTTHQIITQLYKAESIGQTLRAGKLNEYYLYNQAMKKARTSIDSLQLLLTDTLQQARLDTVRRLLRNKEQNMILVLEAMSESPTEELYKQQIDSLILKQDSILRSSHVRRRIITHHNTYTIHHKPKKFFKRLAEVFSPGKEDSTQVNNVIQEEYTDTIDETFSPIDTITTMLTNIQHKVFQSRQENQKTLDARINRLRIAGGRLSQRVNQLLESIEQDEQKAAEEKYLNEQTIRKQAAWTMGIISASAVLLVLIFFTIIWRDITRSNHYRRELEKAKSYAENLLVAREKLMLTITHDIKAPAGSIIGYIDLLTRLVQDKRQVFYLENMKSSAHHLLDLVTSLLDYHRLEAGKMDINPVAFNPQQLFKTIYTSFLPLAERKKLTLYFNNDVPPTLTLEGDPFRIRQIVENLLSNALKFTSTGSVTLYVAYKGNQFTFSVTDTGCGMTEDEKERIFHAFTRLRSAQGQEGFGLGLSITQKLVELLQGSICIDSEPGKGSSFQVSMPLPSISGTSHNEEKEEALNWSGKTLRILLIDDDRIQLNLTEAMLRNLLNSPQSDNQVEITCCEQPDELFELLRQHTFDLLFTDIQMPAMNGFELVKHLKYMSDESIRNLPVVAITARCDMDEEDYRRQGFSGCLRKPFNQSDLREILKQTIKNRGNWETEIVAQTEKNTPVPDYRPDTKYNFQALTLFSEDDEEAAREILYTFAEEMKKNSQQMQEGATQQDISKLGNIAHKMLPTLTMIEAHEILPSLRWLEAHRDEEQMNPEATIHVQQVLKEITEILEALDTKLKVN